MSRGWEGGSDTRWRRFRAYILRRDNYRCRVGGPKCTTHAPQEGGHVDHITPLHLGGAKYDETNARASCPPCNTGRRVAVVAEPPPRPVSRW